MLYGPGPALRQTYADAAPYFGRSPQEQAAYEALTRGVGGMGGEWELPWIFKPAGWVLGARARSCGQAVMGGML
jgi:hypothetical protein